MHWHATAGLHVFFKDWKVNPIEIILKPVCPNNGGDVSCGDVECKEGFDDFVGSIQDLGVLIRRRKAQPHPSSILIGLLDEIVERRIASRQVLTKVVCNG